MRLAATALACLVVAAVTYGIRGTDYVEDYKNGGLHDWLTVTVLYVALIGVFVVCVVALVRVTRELVRVARSK